MAPQLLSQLRPAEWEVTQNLSDSRLPRFEFQEITANEILTCGERAAIAELIEWKGEMPCRRLRPGRSVYVETTPGSAWSIEGFKVKGAGGLVQNQPSGTFVYLPPDHSSQFGLAPELHVAMDKTLTLRTVMGEPKAERSLRLKNAEQEYRCHLELSKVDLGTRPLLYGRLCNVETGAVERDFRDMETGVVALEFGSKLEFVTPYIHFELFDSDRGPIGTSPQIGPASGHAPHPDELVDNYLYFLGELGHLRRRAVLDAGIGRHSGQTDNFVYHDLYQRFLLTDTDSCILFSEIEIEERGPQLLRDLARDTQRMISNLTYFGYSDYFCSALESKSYLPFHRYLSALFHDMTDPSEIVYCAGQLHDAYMNLLQYNQDRFKVIKDQRLMQMTGDNGVPEIQLRGTWHFHHIPFLVPCLEVLYGLIRKSSYADAGFSLPQVALNELRRKFVSGISEFMATTHQHSEIAKQRLRSRNRTKP